MIRLVTFPYLLIVTMSTLRQNTDSVLLSTTQDPCPPVTIGVMLGVEAQGSGFLATTKLSILSNLTSWTTVPVICFSMKENNNVILKITNSLLGETDLSVERLNYPNHIVLCWYGSPCLGTLFGYLTFPSGGRVAPCCCRTYPTQFHPSVGFQFKRRNPG